MPVQDRRCLPAEGWQARALLYWRYVATMVRPMKSPMKIAVSNAMHVSLGALGLLALQGCTSTATNLVDWWHQAEGGVIAAQRPPPPNADAPYPNLATVPPRPAPVDTAARAALANGLVADRTNAQYAASLAPLPTVPAARPAAPAPLPADAGASGATLPAAAAPPPPKVGPLGPPQPPLAAVPATPPRRAPTQPVQAAALPAPTQDPTPGVARPAAPIATLPPIPDAPPPPPRLTGAPAAVAPTPSPATPAPPPPPPPPAPTPGAPVLVAFPPGSATLPVESLGALKFLARQRGAQPVAVTGYGDAATSSPAAQSAALPLAIARARAIASNLLAAGVPASAIRINAEAQGAGGAARLVN